MDLEGKGCTIQIFVSNDTDSLASLKILSVSSLFKINSFAAFLDIAKIRRSLVHINTSIFK